MSVILESKDVDPYGTEMLNRFESAMVAKKQGDNELVIKLLMSSVSPPSIFHGHYRELFIALRRKNKELLSVGSVQSVIDTLKEMSRLDDEMLQEMCSHWSGVHKVKRSRKYFFSYSKIKITDMKLLLKLCTQIDDKQGVKLANKRIKEIENNKK